MKMLLIGYGKMGKAIEKLAIQRGHSIVDIVDAYNHQKLSELIPGEVEVAIEFTEPTAAYSNIKECLSKGIPIISGTTGWLDKMDLLLKYCKEKNGTFFYSPNFSIGMNVFFQVNKCLARFMNQLLEYDISIEEVHSVKKKDKPSGTSIAIAQHILANIERKKNWHLNPTTQKEDIEITSVRTEDTPGVHVVKYESKLDSIDFKHVANSTDTFATGVIMVAEWLGFQKGVLTMDDFMRYYFKLAC
jgi:4-hydroxy-tetrahydrodipicolinate reductase